MSYTFRKRGVLYVADGPQAGWGSFDENNITDLLLNQSCTAFVWVCLWERLFSKTYHYQTTLHDVDAI